MQFSPIVYIIKRLDAFCVGFVRGYSADGSAIRSHRIGQGFESPYLHQRITNTNSALAVIGGGGFRFFCAFPAVGTFCVLGRLKVPDKLATLYIKVNNEFIVINVKAIYQSVHNALLEILIGRVAALKGFKPSDKSRFCYGNFGRRGEPVLIVLQLELLRL